MLYLITVQHIIFITYALLTVTYTPGGGRPSLTGLLFLPAVRGRQESLHHHHQLVRHGAVQGGPGQTLPALRQALPRRPCSAGPGGRLRAGQGRGRLLPREYLRCVCVWLLCVGTSKPVQTLMGSDVALHHQEYKLLFEGAGSNPGDKTLEDRFFEHEVRHRRVFFFRCIL